MIEVISAGIYSTIQDKGRFGYRNMGVPVSGAMDHYSAFVANSLVGNDINAAVLEMTFNGPHLNFHKSAIIAVAGAPIVIKLNNQIIKQSTVINITKGDVLALGAISCGVRCYLAIAGGFNSPKVLNSRSYYSAITKHTQLHKGDEIDFDHSAALTIRHHSTVHLDEKHFNNNRINVYPGPEFHTLSDSIKAQIFNKKFKVASTSNRMAYTFELGIDIKSDDKINEIITSSVQPGTVQLTPSGELIVLMRDCQTTGGYVRILQLTEHSINQLSQKTPAIELQFNLID